MNNNPKNNKTRTFRNLTILIFFRKLLFSPSKFMKKNCEEDMNIKKTIKSTNKRCMHIEKNIF